MFSAIDTSVVTTGLRDDQRGYANFYAHDVVICQAMNPCAVKWKVLGFWIGDELDELKSNWGAKSENV